MKKGQLQLTFHWIYILIAGAVILLFFAGIVVKQKAASDERLTQDLVKIMESIFSGASVAESTKEFIDTSGLAEYTMVFDCEEGVSMFGIEDTNARTQDAITPIYAPNKLQTTRIILWSLPYNMPFKVTDVLFITSQDIKYYVFGNSVVALDFVNSVQHKDQRLKLNVEKVKDFSQVDEVGTKYVRVIDFDGDFLGNYVPKPLEVYPDDKVTAVRFLASQSAVEFYQKEGKSWKLVSRGQIPIFALGKSGIYGAIFTANDKTYECNNKKALKRLEYVSQIYQKKLESLKNKYVGDVQKGCVAKYEQISALLNTIRSSAQTCLELGSRSDSCIQMIDKARNLEQENEKLRGVCIPLY